MNIYGLLTKLVEAKPWTDADRADAVRLLSNLERFHAFGIAGEFEERDHDHVRADVLFPKSMQCQICGAGMDAPAHTCVPREVRANAASAEIRCMICNSEMPSQPWPAGAPAVMMIASDSQPQARPPTPGAFRSMLSP